MGTCLVSDIDFVCSAWSSHVSWGSCRVPLVIIRVASGFLNVPQWFSKFLGFLTFACWFPDWLPQLRRSCHASMIPRQLWWLSPYEYGSTISIIMIYKVRLSSVERKKTFYGHRRKKVAQKPRPRYRSSVVWLPRPP